MPIAYTRRHLLRAASTTALLAACTTPAAVGSASPGRVVSPTPAPDSSATKLVRDVLDFTLRGPYQWNGGRVTMRMYAGAVAGSTVYFVRTDTSDAAFAKLEGLVFVPLLAAARVAKPKGVADLFLFDDGAPGQLPVLSTMPGQADFTSLFVVHRARWRGPKARLDSADAVRAAERSGGLTIEPTNTIVNYPLVKWPGGELPVDQKVEKALEGGPLLARPDVDKLQVTFKLHQCFPESRYIVTDTSAVPMAPMMNIAGSPATSGLAEAGATSKITVFGNGLAGPGAMGFQPAIFQAKAGDAAWSPMWDHWTAVWKDPARTALVRDQQELDARVSRGEIVLHRGTPDTKGQGFVVNCPSPLTAPNDFAVR